MPFTRPRASLSSVLTPGSVLRPLTFNRAPENGPRPHRDPRGRPCLRKLGELPHSVTPHTPRSLCPCSPPAGTLFLQWPLAPPPLFQVPPGGGPFPHPPARSPLARGDPTAALHHTYPVSARWFIAWFPPLECKPPEGAGPLLYSLLWPQQPEDSLAHNRPLIGSSTEVPHTQGD